MRDIPHRRPIPYGNRRLPAVTLPLLAAAVMASTLISCEESTTEEDTRDISRIEIVSGNSQSERVGALLPEPLVVEVTDILGDPRKNIEVRFEIDAAGGSVSPAVTTTDDLGLASTVCRLGTAPGTQHVGAAGGGDSTFFTLSAEALGCPEEDPAAACVWPEDHVFITTTSSELISATGSVLIDFDPATGDIEKVLETTEILVDLAFSPRGELYVATNSAIYRVDPVSKTLVLYTAIVATSGLEIDGNPGGVLGAIADAGFVRVGCPGDLGTVFALTGVDYEALTIRPDTRTIVVPDGSGTSRSIRSWAWDGRSDAAVSLGSIILYTGTGIPRGACSDDEGTVYITIDGNDAQRRIAKITTAGTVEPAWFDFYAYFGGNATQAGRWGDITLLGDRLFLIDRRNNRLVAITTDAQWDASWESDYFSLAGVENERYGIAATPPRDCP
jgi:hypothetical protein